MATKNFTKLVLPVAAAAVGASFVLTLFPRPELQGAVARVAATKRPAVEAAFARESYRPGEVASLRLFDRAPRARVQLFRAGTEAVRLAPRDVMLGTAVGRAVQAAGRSSIPLAIGDWASGLYFARVTAGGGRVGYAPFVLRPRTLGRRSRAAVVLPTLTWQAYNHRDDDGDGDEDTWYAHASSNVRLARPYENRGVPPHYKYYDQPFLRWLQTTRRSVDYLSQSDVERAGGVRLSRAYDLIVFSGHHEYVTAREYDAVETFRDRGGNLMFLSANNFFWKVEKRGNVMRRVAKWRHLGRPEASLVGVQYIGNDEGQRRGAWRVTRAGAAHWAFAGTGVRAGTAFSNGGIEIDKTNASSPRGTRVLAEIRDLFGPGMTGQMTYYETPNGAKVFAAGAFTLAGASLQPPVSRLLGNLWTRLAVDRAGTFLTARAAGYGWPVMPFDRQHPVRGYFGDPRIGESPDGRRTEQFHFGVDVSAANGTAVYATISGPVSFLRADAISVAGPNGVAFEYWHVVPTVRPGAHVTAYKTMIGRVEKPWAHVHFSERRNGVYVNPLRKGAMGPFTDDADPAVSAVHTIVRGGSAELLADVADETPLLVPEPWAGLPVMPTVVQWRVAGGRWHVVADFRRFIPRASAFDGVFAPATRQNHAGRPGLYRIRLGSIAVTQAAHRRVEVAVVDQGGNRAARTFDVGLP